MLRACVASVVRHARAEFQGRPALLCHFCPSASASIRASAHISSSRSSLIASGMRAVQITEQGGTDVLKVREVEAPSALPGTVVVRNAVAGINFIDTYHRCWCCEEAWDLLWGAEGVVRAARMHENQLPAALCIRRHARFFAAALAALTTPLPPLLREPSPAGPACTPLRCLTRWAWMAQARWVQRSSVMFAPPKDAPGKLWSPHSCPMRSMHMQVVEVGEGVTGFKPGDRVAYMGSGSYAELTRVSASTTAHVPEGLSLEAAATAMVQVGCWLRSLACKCLDC